MDLVRIGTSGWSYPHWRRRFYPPGLPQRAELEYLAQRLDSVEINASFYRLQRPSAYRGWAAQTPDDFVFAVKGSRFLTHLKQLREPRQGLANFLASGLLALGGKLGPILWQLPASIEFDRTRLDGFLAELPRSTAAASALARRHDERLGDRSGDRVVLESDGDRPMIHVLEPRHASFRAPVALDLLREHGVGLVQSDGAGRWPLLRAVTSDVVYIRLHGHQQLYASGYDRRALRRWATRIRAWADDGRAVYVYFDNDGSAHAPADAVTLRDLLNSGDAGGPPAAAHR